MATIEMRGMVLKQVEGQKQVYLTVLDLDTGNQFQAATPNKGYVFPGRRLTKR